MDGNQGYLFDTREECCEAWFAFSSCPDALELSEDPKFYPDNARGMCGQKKASEFKPWEIDSFEMYDSLEECCSERFPYNLDGCCGAEGLGGCGGANQDAGGGSLASYVPDWVNMKCSAKTNLVSWEVSSAKPTAQSCCHSWFEWDEDECCDRSGGCK